LGSRATMPGWKRGMERVLRGDFRAFPRARIAASIFKGGWDPAAVGMFDCASWITEERLVEFQSNRYADLVRDVHWYQAYCNGWEQVILPAKFRGPLPVSVPTLLIAGTWDVYTPLENAVEMASQLSGGNLIKVIRGSHDALSEVLEARPELAADIIDWLRDQSAKLPGKIVLPVVNFDRLIPQ